MTPKQQQELQEHIKAISKILYGDTPAEQLRPLWGLTSLSGIEQAVRSQMQKHVMPEVGVFLSKGRQAQAQAISDDSEAFLESFLSPVNKPSNSECEGTAN